MEWSARLPTSRKTTAAEAVAQPHYLQEDVQLSSRFSLWAAMTWLVSRASSKELLRCLQNKTNSSVFWLKLTHTSVDFVNVAFSYPLFGNGAWWRPGRLQPIRAVIEKGRSSSLLWKVWWNIRELENANLHAFVDEPCSFYTFILAQTGDREREENAPIKKSRVGLHVFNNLNYIDGSILLTWDVVFSYRRSLTLGHSEPCV